MIESNNTTPTSTFFSKIRNEMKVFSNSICIVDKLELDGNFLLLSNMFHQLFHHEITYAVYGKLKRA